MKQKIKKTENKLKKVQSPEASKKAFRDNETFPMRINKRVAHLGLATRKEADELVISGNILVNGKEAILGQKVFETDEVMLKGSRKVTDYVYYAYHKPENVVTIGAQTDEKEIKDVLTLDEEVFPVGRLDKESHGLLILTNDGRVTNRLLSPQFDHEKEYRVTVNKEVSHQMLVRFVNGVRISKTELTAPAKARRVDSHTIDIVLTEGKNRQIRRMCGALGYQVNELLRFRIMNIELGNLKANQTRKITGRELKEFLKLLDLQ